MQENKQTFQHVCVCRCGWSSVFGSVLLHLSLRAKQCRRQTNDHSADPWEAAGPLWQQQQQQQSSPSCHRRVLQSDCTHLASRALPVGGRSNDMMMCAIHAARYKFRIVYALYHTLQIFIIFWKYWSGFAWLMINTAGIWRKWRG